MGRIIPWYPIILWKITKGLKPPARYPILRSISNHTEIQSHPRTLVLCARLVLRHVTAQSSTDHAVIGRSFTTMRE
jgi:hypothetical protein